MMKMGLPDTPHRFAPRNTPERLQARASVAQPLSYFVPPPPIGWAVAGAFSIAHWHVGKAVLAKHGIIARMGNSVDESGVTTELLVPAAQEEYARSLLSDGMPSLAGVESVQPRPSHRQDWTHNIILALLWLALIVVSILTAVSLLLSS